MNLIARTQVILAADNLFFKVNPKRIFQGETNGEE